MSENTENKRCAHCAKESDDLHNTAFFVDRTKLEGVCQECKKALEAEDLDEVTHAAFDSLCHVVNGGSKKKLAESMMRTFYKQHRYLQGEFFMALAAFFKLYGELDANHYDARNEFAVKMAQRWDKETNNF